MIPKKKNVLLANKKKERDKQYIKINKSKYPWEHELYNNGRLQDFIDSINFYVKPKDADYYNIYNKVSGPVDDLKLLKVYGIKQLDWSMHSLTLPPKNRSHIFVNFRPHYVVEKMYIPYSAYRRGSIVNPVTMRTKHIDNKLRVVCAIGFTRLITKFAIGDLIPFDKKLKYPAYLYNFASASIEEIESILDENSLEEVSDIIPEFTRDISEKDARKNQCPRLIEPVNKIDWYEEDGVDYVKEFWQTMLDHEYELHFYRHGVLEFSFNLGKKPLRINIDCDGIPSWIGVAQVSLWFFFGIDTWHGEQYFSIGD